MQKQVKCPKCKTQQPLGDKCVSCGLDFREYARKIREKRASQGAAPRRVRCPECGKVQPMGKQCVDCGLDFREYARKKKEQRAAESQPPAVPGGKPEEKPATEEPSEKPEEKPEEKPAPKKRGPRNYRDEKPVDIVMPVFEREPELSSIGELLGNTWLIFKSRFGVLLGLYLISVAMLAVPMSATFGVGFLTALTWPGAFVLMAIVSTLGGLIGLLAWAWGFGAFISASCDEMQGFREALGKGWRNMWSLFWLYLLMGALIQGGFILLILPGIVWTVSFIAAPFVLFEEQEKGMSALLKSRAYVKGHWWGVFGRLLVIIVLMMLASLVPFGSLVFTPFMMIYLVLIYRELRTIKGEDMEFRPSGGAKAAWTTVALIGVLLPLALLIAGAFSIYKSGMNFSELKSLSTMDFSEFEMEEIPAPEQQPQRRPERPQVLHEPELGLDKMSFVSGESITIHFKAPSTFPPDAWVGIVPSTVPHGSESLNDRNVIFRKSLNNMTAGDITLPAPPNPGIYDVRMNDSDQNGNEVASETFAVESGTTP